jgi:molybdopterin converting factor subunit 1
MEGMPPSFFFIMRLRVLFFASYRELLGTGQLEVDLPGPATVADLLGEIRARGEPYASLPSDPVVAVNREFASPHTPLGPGDEVALVPPVAGG